MLRDLEWLQCQVKECVYVCVGVVGRMEEWRVDKAIEDAETRI